MKRRFPLQSQVSLPLFEAVEADAAKRAEVGRICAQTSEAKMLIMRAAGFAFIMTTTNDYEQNQF